MFFQNFMENMNKKVKFIKKFISIKSIHVKDTSNLKIKDLHL